MSGLQAAFDVQEQRHDKIAVESGSVFGSAKLLVNGQPAPPGPQTGRCLLRRNDGTEVIARFKGSFPDPAPVLVVGEETIRFAAPLAWYEWLWAGFPLLLILLGGAVGGAVGALAFTVKAQLFRSSASGFAKYALSAVVSLIGIVLWLFIISLLRR